MAITNEDEFRDLASRCQELQEFFEDVRVTFSQHTDSDTQAQLKTAVSQFKTLNEELSRVANGQQDVQEAFLHEREIAQAEAENAIPLVENIIEQEMKAVITEIDDILE